MAVGAERVNRLIATGAGFAAFMFYVLTLAPDVLPGDSGEFQFAAPMLGIVHPTGYPLYLLLAKVFALLPLGSPAYRVNFFSAVCGALAVALFYLTVERSVRGEAIHTNARWAVALASAATLAFTPTFQAQATRAEVYALNILFVVAMFFVVIRLLERRDENAVAGGKGARAKLVFVGAAVIGLSLAHHRTTLLLVPALAVAVWSVRLPAKAWFGTIALMLLPLVLYTYTPLRYDSSPYTRIVLDSAHIITTLEQTPQGFAAHALGTGFGGELRWGEAALVRLAETPARIAAEFGGAIGLGALLAAVGGLVTMARAAQSRRQAVAIGVTAGGYVAFNALYQIGDIADYYTPVYMIVVWLIGWGGAWLATRRTAWAAPIALIGVWSLSAWVVISCLTSLAPYGDSRTWAVETLTSSPQDAILLSNDRDELTPIYYVQLVDGRRQDVAVLFPRIAPSLGHVVPLTRYALETRRPVMLVKDLDGLETVFTLQRTGSLTRVTGPAPDRPDRMLAVESVATRLRGWSVRADASAVEVSLFWQAKGARRDDFSTFVHLLDSAGNKVAQSDHAPGGIFYPPSQWSEGELIRDLHRIALPAGAPSILRVILGAYGSDAVEGVRIVEAGTLNGEE